jgi:hypothetical protein
MLGNTWVDAQLAASQEGLSSMELVIPTISCSSVGFVILTVVVMESSIVWDITPCSPVKVNRRFGETCRLHLQGRRINQARNKREAGSRQSQWLRVYHSTCMCSNCVYWFFFLLTVLVKLLAICDFESRFEVWIVLGCACTRRAYFKLLSVKAKMYLDFRELNSEKTDSQRCVKVDVDFNFKAAPLMLECLSFDSRSQKREVSLPLTIVGAKLNLI